MKLHNLFNKAALPVLGAILLSPLLPAGVAEAAAGALEAGITPIDDVRSTASYRRAVSGRILLRLLRDEGGW